MSQSEGSGKEVVAGSDSSAGVPSDLPEVWMWTEAAIEDDLFADQPILRQALPGTGKTESFFKVAARHKETDFFYAAGRTDLYEDAEDRCNEYDIDHATLPAPHRTCPTFGGDHGEALRDYLIRLYSLGIPAPRLHREFDLPCDDGSECDYLQRWRSIREDPPQVIIGNPQHTYVETMVEDRTVVFDEFPDQFEKKFDDVEETVNRYLDQTPGLPFDEYAEVVGIDHDEDLSRVTKALAYLSANGAGPNVELALDGEDGARVPSHAPYLTFALLTMRDLDNGFEFCIFPTLSPYGLTSVRHCVRHRESGDVFVLSPPDLSEANQVVGLDGTPTAAMWRIATDADFEVRTLFDDDEERNRYLKDTLGLTFCRANEGLKAYGGGAGVTPKGDTAVFYAVESGEGERPVLITTKAALARYRRSEDILAPMKDELTYGNILSTNRFEDESTLIVAGAPHPGDDVIQRWAAYDAESVTAIGTGMDKTYGDLGDEIYHHFVHNQVLQAAMRAGRAPDVEATVYLITGALPEWVKWDKEVNTHLDNSPSKREIVQYLHRQDGQWVPKKEIVEETGYTDETVGKSTNELEEVGYLESEHENGKSKFWRYRP